MSRCQTLCTKRAEYVAKSSGDETLVAPHVGLGLGANRMQGARPVIQRPGLVQIDAMQKLHGLSRHGTGPNHGL